MLRFLVAATLTVLVGLAAFIVAPADTPPLRVLAIVGILSAAFWIPLLWMRRL